MGRPCTYRGFICFSPVRNKKFWEELFVYPSSGSGTADWSSGVWVGRRRVEMRTAGSVA
jgi:hypothetical protein